AHSQETFSTNDVLDSLKNSFTRAYVLRFINNLVREGKLVKSGTTRAAVYVLTEKRGVLKSEFRKRYKNNNLKEHEVLEEVNKKLNFLHQLPEHIQSIFSYAFSEMLNNAIDHSKSENIAIYVKKIDKGIRFIVDDFGIGVFKNIMNKRKLNSSLEAIQDLLKGKITTMPRAHSGEGIFFTSKVSDVFVLESYDCQLKIDNIVEDVFVNDLKPSKSGTRVIFEISLEHSGYLDDVFKQYYTDPEDLAFDKTEIKIKLYTKESIYVSRSQAKRVLAGLEKFRTIVLDFDQVSGVGQAFADEIFRVFQSKYPEIKIIPENMIEAVKFMIERVEKP
ncbi:MAG: DUF4325 domain-containing protein, partial [Nitrospirae bacterium]|nr:DUF4325 domain-containing protein [Nitrospirota bacterium]